MLTLLVKVLVVMEAGVPIPVPADLVMLLVGERAAAGAVPLWLALTAFEMVAILAIQQAVPGIARAGSLEIVRPIGGTSHYVDIAQVIGKHLIRTGQHVGHG